MFSLEIFVSDIVIMTGNMERIMARIMANPMAVDTRMLAVKPLATNNIHQSFAKV
jgi:hypothetical protein